MRIVYEEFLGHLGVTLEYNHYKGGDSGHGGYIKIIIKNISSSDMSVDKEKKTEVELLFRGDIEKEALKNALNMIVKDLNNNLD